MGREKKKDSKKGEKSLPSLVARDAPLNIGSSIRTGLPGANQADKQLGAASMSREEAKKLKVRLVPEPIVYEAPALTELIVESYKGEKVHGLYEGEGIACFQGGSVYKGMFLEGLMHGQGTYTWADGVKYEGTFEKNMQMQHGVYTWPDGSTYDGEVKAGIRHGFGMYKCGTHPVSYIGQWVDGKRHGKGIVYYNKEGSSWYDGDFVCNVKSGWGMRCYKSGNIYEGQWERDMYHGSGRMKWQTTNQEYTGKWVNGVPHGFGVHVWYLKRIPGSQYPMRNEYVGEFVNGERHGCGKFFFATGAMYDGEWVNNKKHGMGKLVFKNGHVYEGEFIYDHIAEYPTFKIDIMNIQDLSGIRTKRPLGIEGLKVVDGPRESSTFETDIEIDISTLLDLFPKEDREEEMKQMEFVLLRHISKLRRIYSFYSSLGYDRSVDNTFVMIRLQFWRFLKDCKFHHCKFTLADMDRILNDKTVPEDIHSPYETVFLWMFLTDLIYLAFYIYYKEITNTAPRLFICFSKLLAEKINPNACQVKGVLFTDRQQTVYIFNYIEKCWEIYRDFSQTNPLPPHEPIMKMRHFLWMLKDLKLINRQLTASKVVNILAKGNTAVRNEEDIILEHEMVFLDFFETLMKCALVFITDDMVKNQVEEVSELDSSYRMENFVAGVQLSPPLQDLRLGQPAHPRRTSSGEAINRMTDATRLLISKTSTSKVVHFVDLDKAKKSEMGKTKEGQKEEKAARRDSKSSLKERRRSSDPLQNAKNEQKDRHNLWMSQIYIFFGKLFAGYKHLQAVKETILDNRVWEAEEDSLRKIQEEEEDAKLKAMLEAEELRKLEEAEAEAAAAAAAEKAALELEEDMEMGQEIEDILVQLPPTPPKEEPPVVPQVLPSTKAMAGGKKKKKSAQ